jgi:TrmH family RNA methyltransferase
MMLISSATNERFRSWKSLLSSKGIKEQGQFLLSGEKIIREFYKKLNLEIIAELVPKGREFIFTNCDQYELPAELFRELDELGTHFNLLVLKTPEIKTFDLSNAPDGLEILCPLGDPANVGALIRSAEAFGVSKFILSQESANPFLPKSVKASSGSVLRMPLFKGPPLAGIQISKNNPLIVLDGGGEALSKFKWPKNVRLLIGEEGQGSKSLSKELSTKSISIETQGVESLNAVVASSIAMFDYRSKTRN